MAETGETPRLPARLEVSALVRQVQQEGGFAAVLARGEPEAGTILLVLVDNGRHPRAFERMPQPGGERVWTLSRQAEESDAGAFAQWLERRQMQDPDLWIVELDIPNGERFIPRTGSPG